MKRSLQNILIVGFALFSMLFGAGNVIFPPYLGLSCGADWLQGFFFYYMADIGLALVCLFAIQRCGGHRNITGHLGSFASEMLICVIILCIGPMLGIPRTAASTFEMSMLPLFPNTSPVIFACCFFAAVALLCVKQSAVVDIIGKILTPALILGLLILIIKGVASPIGYIPDEVYVDNVPITGISAGYQTMDVLAIVIFGILIAKNVREKGYTKLREQNFVIGGSGLLAGLILMIIYLGLSYLGVSASQMYDISVDRTVLVTSIVQVLMGRAGMIIFAVVVALACITTAVALVSCCADYFSSLTGGKIKYIWIVLFVCAFSSVVSNFGLNQIIAIAAPILEVVYPPTLIIIFLSFFDRWIKNDWVFRMAAICACVLSLMNVLKGFGAPFGFLDSLPLSGVGFGWILPSLVFAALGFLIRPKKAE